MSDVSANHPWVRHSGPAGHDDIADINLTLYSPAMVRSGIRKHLTILALLALASASCGPSSPKNGSSKLPPSLEEIVKLSQQVCECRMAGRDVTAISAKLGDLTKSLQVRDTETHEYPVFSKFKCFPQIGEQACVGQNYLAPEASDATLVCTSEQIMDLTNLSGEFTRTHGGSDHEALLKRLTGMRREMANKMPQSACSRPRA